MSLIFATALFIVKYINSSGKLGLTVASAISIVLAAVAAYLIAIYRLYVRTARRIYRNIVRPIAKRAIRSSLSQHMTRFECTGIIDRDGTVALLVQPRQGIQLDLGETLNVHESAGNQLWGRLIVNEFHENSYICKLDERNNVEFWAHLEVQMKIDTSPPPNIYLVREFPENLLNFVDIMLDQWK